jgi:hypothetical protein
MERYGKVGGKAEYSTSAPPLLVVASSFLSSPSPLHHNLLLAAVVMASNKRGRSQSFSAGYVITTTATFYA